VVVVAVVVIVVVVVVRRQPFFGNSIQKSNGRFRRHRDTDMDRGRGL